MATSNRQRQGSHGVCSPQLFEKSVSQYMAAAGFGLLIVVFVSVKLHAVRNWCSYEFSDQGKFCARGGRQGIA